MKKAILGILLILALGAWGCSPAGSGGGAGADKGEKADSGETMTEDGRATISMKEMEEEYESLPPAMRSGLEGQEGAEVFVENMISKELLYREAKRRGLAESDLVRDELERYKKSLMIGVLLEQEIGDASEVSDEDVRNFYDENKERFLVEQFDGKGSSKKEYLEFERIAPVLKERLAEQKRREAAEEYLDNLLENSKVEFDREDLKEKAVKIIGNSPSGQSPLFPPPEAHAGEITPPTMEAPAMTPPAAESK